MFQVSSLGVRWSPNVGAVSPSVNAVGTTPGGTNWRQAGRFRKISESISHKTRGHARDANQQERPQFATYIACTSEFRAPATLFVEDSVDALVDALCTRILQKIRSRIPVSTHTPAPSAAIDVQTFEGTAILVTVTHLPLSIPWITTPHPLLPLSLKLPSHEPFTAFHVSELIHLSRTMFLSFSVHFLCLWLSVSPCVVVCCCVLVCVGVCVECVVCCVWGVVRGVCVGVCGVVCGAAWHAEKTSVCRFKTSPCVPAPRALVAVHTETFWLYTRRFCGRTHRGEGGEEGEEREGHRQFCLPWDAHAELSCASERFTKRNLCIFRIFKFENRSRTTRFRVLQSFALPDEAVELHFLSWGTLRRESAVRFESNERQKTTHRPTHHHHSSPPPPSTHTHHTHSHKHQHKDTQTHTHTHMYMQMFLYMYLKMKTYLCLRQLHEAKNMKPPWKVTSMYIFHSAGQHSCKRWNWRSRWRHTLRNYWNY